MPATEPVVAYEAASLQAIAALQSIYGFVVLNYSIHSLHLYRSLAQRLFPIANRGTQLARLVVAASQQQSIPLSALVLTAEDLLNEVVSSPVDCVL